MSYTTVHIECNEELAETISTLLLEIGFDGTAYENGLLQAFIPASEFDNNALNKIADSLELHIKAITDTPDQNWNQLWEDNFHDLSIDNQIHIRAPFHQDKGFKHEIIIHPKMAFGTGHHGTTQLMLKEMLNIDFKNKTVLDMGCGSGILSILASQKGANKVTAIDYDINSVENSSENTQLNKIQNVTILQSDNLDKVTTTFDIILSNIVKNINLSLMPSFSRCLKPGGLLVICGLLITDLDEATQTAKALNLKLLQHSNDGEWLRLNFEKINA